MWQLPAEAFVVPVNCVGVHGAGVALQWAQRCPEQVVFYKTLCKHGNIDPGETIVFEDGIILAATKDHFARPSQVNWIQHICEDLAQLETGEWPLKRDRFRSIALPKLGCGLGKLNWERQVMPLFDQYLTRSGIHFMVSI
jgi:O-acetyl-ADP-ribose deacetylase (regulator of RNase III)